MLSHDCNHAVKLLALYLNQCPDAFGTEDVEGLARDCHIERSQAMALLVASACGLEIDDNLSHRELYHKFFLPAFHELDPRIYENNPYWQTIKLDNKIITEGAWQLGYEQYKAYELFVANDMAPLGTGTESEGRDYLPYLGFFTRDFKFPTVKEKGRIWMTITPNEVETMRLPIAAARSHVVTFGLGLGYYTFMCAIRPSVTKVTVVERDEDVIQLFEKHILPQFPEDARCKVQIIRDDAFHFAEFNLPAQGDVQIAFVDLWHDVSDGLPLYQRMKQIASRCPGIEWHYWIEKSMNCYL